MLINLLAIDNYNNYNIELAKTIGLHEAIYLNEIINLTEKAQRKNAVNDGFITLNRDYIKSRTTFDVDEQKELQKIIESCKLIRVDKSNKDKVCLEADELVNMLLDGNESVLKNAVKDVKNAKKLTKADEIRIRLKANVKVSNEELRNAYCEWIDSVYNKRGYMDKKAVIEGQKVVDEYCNRDLDKALKIIEIATIHSYIDMNWAVSAFKRDYASLFNKSQVIQGVEYLSKEVF